MTQASTTSYVISSCPGCGGAKVQRNKDGINVRCPVCGGSGLERPLGIEVTC